MPVTPAATGMSGMSGIVGIVEAGPSPWYLPAGLVAADCLGAYMFKGAASEAAALANLVTPGTLDMTKVESPTWSASTGFTTTTENYLSVDVLTPPLAVIGQYTNVVDGGNPALVQNALAIYPTNTDNGAPYYVVYNADDGAGATWVLPSLLAGNLAIARNTTTKKFYGYRNGVADTAEISIMTNKTGTQVDVGYGSMKVVAFAVYNKTLTATQILAIATSMAAF